MYPSPSSQISTGIPTRLAAHADLQIPHHTAANVRWRSVQLLRNIGAESVSSSSIGCCGKPPKGAGWEPLRNASVRSGGDYMQNGHGPSVSVDRCRSFLRMASPAQTFGRRQTSTVFGSFSTRHCAAAVGDRRSPGNQIALTSRGRSSLHEPQ